MTKFKFGEVAFEDLMPGDIVEGKTPDGRLATFEATSHENTEIVNEATEKSGIAEFGVNLSSKNIPVYTTSSGTTVAATIYPKECFVFTGATSGSRYQIECVNSKGAWIKGWYVGTSGVSYWRNRPYYNGYIKVSGSPGFKAKVYKITKACGIYHGSKAPLGPGTLYSGSYIFIRADECIPGSTERDWMRFRGLSTQNKDGIYTDCEAWGSYYGYIDTMIKHTPKSPAVRGNW